MAEFDFRTLTMERMQVMMNVLAQQAHPRVLLTPEKTRQLEARFRGQDGRAKMMAHVVTIAREIIPQPVMKREMEGRRLLHVSREALRRIWFLSMAWRLTRDAALLERARLELEAVSSFTDWNPSHYLDVAEMALGVAIGYDWLHEALPESTRALVKKALREKCLETARDSKQWWVTADNNWGQVCHAGVTAAALAIAEDDPEFCALIVHRSIKKIHIAMAAYAPDGAYPEGPIYWHYGTGFNVIFNELCFCAFDTDFEIGKLPGFLDSALFIQHATGPTGWLHNFADAGRFRMGPCEMFTWFEDRYGRALPADAQEKALLNGDTTLFPADYRLAPFFLLTNLKEPVAVKAEGFALDWHARGSTPVAYHRSGRGRDAWWVGLKAGCPGDNHAHMDGGSFVFEAGGVRWAAEGGMEPYHNMESRGVKLWDRAQNGERWSLFRLGAQSHNIVRINGCAQLVNARAVIVSSDVGGESPETVIDVSPLYRGFATRVVRRVTLVKRSRLVIVDTFEGLPEDAEITWQMLTSATVEKTAEGVVLRKEGKVLRGTSTLLPHGVVEVQAVEELMRPYELEMPGHVMLRFKGRVKDGGAFEMRTVFEG